MKRTLTIVAAFSMFLLLPGMLSCKHDSTGPSNDCEPKAVKPDTSVGASLAIQQPLGCEELFLGDSIEIKWTYYKQDYGRVAVMLSLQGGAENTFDFIWNNAIAHAGPTGGNVWQIPDSAKYVTDNAVIRIYDYDGGFEDRSGSFSIQQR